MLGTSDATWRTRERTDAPNLAVQETTDWPSYAGAGRAVVASHTGGNLGERASSPAPSLSVGQPVGLLLPNLLHKVCYRDGPTDPTDRNPFVGSRWTG